MSVSTNVSVPERYVPARRILGFLNLVRAVPHIMLFHISPAKGTIRMDVERWLAHLGVAEEFGGSTCRALAWLLWRYREFRNIVHYRVEQEYHWPSRILLEVARWIYRRSDTLFLYTPEIGPGLFIEHGFSTVIAAKRIGSNCWVNQQVTIGYSDDGGCPEIGDNVRIAAGAVVFGDIAIGDNAVIGANALVCKSVPADCTVVGVPARIVRRGGQRVDEAL